MMLKTKNRPSPLIQTYRIPFVIWIITALAVSCVFFSHIYSDILITAKQGMKFWDCLFSGNPLSFYKEAVFELSCPYDGYVFHAAYPFTIYLLFI